MQPRDLTEAMFQRYDPLGGRVALRYLPLLRDLPLVLDAILLRELQQYDTSFPAERAAIDSRFEYLASLSADARHALTHGFAALSLSPELSDEDWVQSPRRFEEDLSAHLWASHQTDVFRVLGESFVLAVDKARPGAQPTSRRLVIVVVPPELHKPEFPPFRKLLPYGTLFAQIDTSGASDGMNTILQKLDERATNAPAPYGHWYLDGGKPLPCSSSAMSLSWAGSEPIRTAVLNKVQSIISSGSAGPEMLRSVMVEWAHSGQSTDPVHPVGGDSIMDAFVQSIYGEGSGTQIFSTTFVQWSTRELLKRAQPLTLVARFGARQRQRSMNEMFTSTTGELDFAGSAIDADFAAYYTWINLQRLPGGEAASFIAWSQHHGRAVAIGPDFPRNVESPNPTSIERLLKLVADA